LISSDNTSYHVCPQSVTAHRRDFDGAQDGGERRCVTPCDVVVPVVLHARRHRVLGKGDHIRCGLAGLGVLEERVLLQLPPQKGELPLLVAADLLVTEDEHLPLEQGSPELGDHLPVEIPAKTDAVDLGADRGCHRRDGETIVRPGVEQFVDTFGDERAERGQGIGVGDEQMSHVSLLGCQWDGWRTEERRALRRTCR
jgi:hypothetical protein